MGQSINTPVGRVLWTDLQEPDQFGKYSVKVAFDEDADLSGIEAAIKEAGEEQFGKTLPKKVALPIKDGNEETDDAGEVYASSKNMRIIRFKSTRKPPCIGPAGGEDLIEASDIYSGCYIKVKADFFGYTHPQGGKGVSAGMSAIQFVRNGERIGGGAPVDLKTAFGKVEEDEQGTENPWG
jgi:hypothetical protein